MLPTGIGQDKHKLGRMLMSLAAAVYELQTFYTAEVDLAGIAAPVPGFHDQASPLLSALPTPQLQVSHASHLLMSSSPSSPVRAAPFLELQSVLAWHHSGTHI